MPFTNAFHKQLKQGESFYVCHSPNKKKVLLRSLFTFFVKIKLASLHHCIPLSFPMHFSKISPSSRFQDYKMGV